MAQPTIIIKISIMTWIDEQTAADMLLLKRPKTLREKAVSAVWPITYTKVARRYQYSKQDIEKLLMANSNKIKSS